MAEQNSSNGSDVKEAQSLKDGASSSDGRGQEKNEEIDTELQELLDSSLADFGKHVPKPCPPDPVTTGSTNSGSLFNGLEGPPGLGSEDQLMKEMEEVFGEEFAKQAEAQFSEAMDMLKFDNPELLKQFEELAKTVGLEETDEEVDHTPSPQPKGMGLEPNTESERPADGQPDIDHTLQSAINDTVRNIQASTRPASNRTQTGGDSEKMEELSAAISEMMGSMNLEEGGADIGGGGAGEEQVMQMMEGMMNTLLSKEVLYPSLVDFCKQYPEWLDRHGNNLSPDDRTRYIRQLETMQAICTEFERDDYKTNLKERQEKILQLMQELQKYGQPPEDLGGMPIPQTPSFLPSPSDSQCSIM